MTRSGPAETADRIRYAPGFSELHAIDLLDSFSGALQLLKIFSLARVLYLQTSTGAATLLDFETMKKAELLYNSCRRCIINYLWFTRLFNVLVKLMHLVGKCYHDRYGETNKIIIKR